MISTTLSIECLHQSDKITSQIYEIGHPYNKMHFKVTAFNSVKSLRYIVWTYGGVGHDFIELITIVMGGARGQFYENSENRMWKCQACTVCMRDATSNPGTCSPTTDSGCPTAGNSISLQVISARQPYVDIGLLPIYQVTCH